VLATGGMASTGGSVSTAGSTASGGAASTGGFQGTGGASSAGGSSGTCPSANPALFAIGADTSWVPQDEAGGATFVDTDGVTKDILALLKNHGFNYIRLRTFVDPTASDGYSSAGYCDIAQTAAMGKRIKDACMGFSLDFHYSDNWADPGKQCIPQAWLGMTLAQMTQQVHDYTYNSIQTLVNAGARPDIVQIGNEISPGMLIHVCGSGGTPTSTNSVNGSTANWTNLAGFLKAGIQGVHDVDPTIKIAMHTDMGGNPSGNTSWLNNALSNGVNMDVYLASCYVAYQGQPSGWQTTFNTLVGASAYASIQLAIGEYNNEPVTSPAGTTSIRDANDIIYNLASNRGFGTFFWEPTHSGGWGSGLFTTSGRVRTAIPSAFAIYDQIKTAYASRL
jgi:arabinogalactan endo-1,4-beta-galactosidase